MPFSTRSVLPAILLAVWTTATLRAQVASVSVPAWIEDDSCAPTPRFAATLNGKPAPVTTQLGPASEQMILVVLDLTGDLPFVDAAKLALFAQITKLPANAWVGLFRDEDGLHVLADPGPNRQPVIDAIRSLTNNGEPGLLETVHSALSLADAIMRKSPVRVSVLYITDSNIYSYREDYTNPVINESDSHDLSRRLPGELIEEKVAKLVGDNGTLEAPLFVVHLKYRGDRLNEVYQNGLGTLAEATGGKADVCRSIAEIPDSIAAMFARISSAWRVTLAVPPKTREDAQVRLSAPCGSGEPRLSWRTHVHLLQGG